MIPTFYDFRISRCNDGIHELHFEAMLTNGATVFGQQIDGWYTADIATTLIVMSGRQEGPRGQIAAQIQEQIMWAVQELDLSAILGDNAVDDSPPDDTRYGQYL